MKNINILKDLKTLNKLHTSSVESYTTNNGIVDFTCDNNGYVDNVVVEGETLVNLVDYSTLNVEGSNCWTFRLKANTVYTLFNFLNDEDGHTCILNEDLTSLIGWTTDKAYTFLNPIDQKVVPHYNLPGFKIVILEGDHTDKPINYFEGLKSVGQGDKIDVLTYKRGSENLASNLTFTEGKYVWSVTGDAIDNVGFKYSNEYIEVEGGCEYLFDNINLQFATYDSSKNIIPFRWQDLQGEQFKGDDYQATFVYVMPKNAKYIRINLPISNLKPYSLIKTKSDKKQISTTLRSLPNGVKDTIEKRGNKYVKVQRCGEVVLDGNVDVPNIYKPNSSLNYHRFLVSVGETPNFGAVYCDRLGSVVDYEIEKDNILADKTYSGFFITLHNDKTSSTREGFKTWLQANPITVVYELATPIITELPNFNPQTFEGDNTLLINSGVIQCDASFDVCEGIRSELDVIKDKVSNLDDNVIIEEIYTPTLLNGWVNSYGVPKLIKNGKTVSIYMAISSGVLTKNTVIFNIVDKKFTPKSGMFFVATCADGSYTYHNATVIVTTSGIVKIDNVPYNNRLVINATWEVE